MKISSIIFDLDGTLTAPILDFAQIRKEMGLGLDTPDILAAMREMAPECREKAQNVLDRHERYAAKNSCLNKGAKSLFLELKTRQLPVGLLTRNTRKNAMAVAEQHDLKFDAIVDRDDGPAKPDAYGVLRLCQLLGVPPEQTLVVGDFVHDLQAAQNAGAVAILIKTHPNAEHFICKADYTIDSLAELPRLIDKLEEDYSRDTK